MNNLIKCPIWGTDATTLPQPNDLDGCRVDSPRAGGCYFISGTAQSTIGNLDAEEKARLTTWLHDERIRGEDIPKVMSSHEAKQSRPLSVHKKVDRLLQFLAGLESHPGVGFLEIIHDNISSNFLKALSWIESSVGFSSQDNQESDDIKENLVKKKQKKEIGFFVDHLVKQGWLEHFKDDGLPFCRLTVEGYIRLAELEATDSPSDTALIA